MSLLDAVAEDSFHENLTLGVAHVLERTPRVSNVTLQHRSPCDRIVLSTWEQRHCCTLPEDLRNFYCSTDGFLLTWDYEFAEGVQPTGKMHINAVADLRRLAGIKGSGEVDFPTLLDIEICNQSEAAPDSSSHPPPPHIPSFGVKCKLFELDHCDGLAKVCLVYMDQGEATPPAIWLVDRCFEWHFLANSFTQYFRMMLVHQGLPMWQFRFTPMGLPPWTEQLFVQVAPHLLHSDAPQAWPPAGTGEWRDSPYNNLLDPSVFRRTTGVGASRRRDGRDAIKKPVA